MLENAHTEPGQDYILHDLGDTQIRKLAVSEMHNNVYLLSNSGRHLLIDAAADAPAIMAMLTEAGAQRLEAIVTTHLHWDHHRALEEVARQTGAPTWASELDAPGLPIAPQKYLADGDSFALGECVVNVIGLRGHTPYGVALWIEEGVAGPNPGRIHLFTGDSLFPGGPGKTANPADFNSLMNDLSARVFDVMPDSTRVYPGHGDDTLLGTERPHLPQWWQRGW